MRFLAGLLAVALALCPAAAQDWPQRGVTVYVPFIAGSTPDALARTVADRLQAKLRHDPALKARTPELEAAVASGRLAPTLAAEEIAQALGL